MCLYALFMLTLQKWAAKKAGRELNHARPLCPRIGWRDEERRKTDQVLRRFGIIPQHGQCSISKVAWE
jgi:hypothetical protein